MVGIGIGIIYHWRGSTAGTDIIALLLKRFASAKVGTALLATDGLIILAVGLSLARRWRCMRWLGSMSRARSSMER